MSRDDWNEDDQLDDEWDEDWCDEGDLDEPLDDAEAARCPECGAWMYDIAERCPKCGYWLSGVDRLTMWRSQPRWVRVTAVIALAAFLIWVFAAALRFVG